MKRRIRSSLLMVFLVALLTQAVTPVGHAAGGTIIDEGWVEEVPKGVGSQGVEFREKPTWDERATQLFARNPYTVCDSLGDPKCASRTNLGYTAMLQECATATSMDCISELGAVDANGTRTKGTFLTQFPAKAINEFTGDPAKGVPDGKSPGLWNIGGVTYYVRAVKRGEMDPDRSFSLRKFGVYINPISIVPMTCYGPCSYGSYYELNAKDTWEFTGNPGPMNGLDCLDGENLNPSAQLGECAKRLAFAPGTRLYAVVKLSQSPRGWMHGRLGNAKLSITKISGTSAGVVIDIEGDSISIPVVHAYRKFDSLPVEMQDQYRADGGWRDRDNALGSYGTSAYTPDKDETNPLLTNRLSLPASAGLGGIAELKAWLPLVNDTASADLSNWGIRTLETAEMNGANSCFANGSDLNGWVTSNATQYAAGPPAFSSTTKSLDYKVAGPHFRSDGSIFRGDYQLAIRSTVARCVYGFSSAPIQATVDVVEENGTTGTATTVVSESNGWLTLSAKGFTHSSPTVRATLTQSATVSPIANVKSRVAVGKSVSRATILKRAGLSVTKRSRVTLAVPKSSAKVCKVTGTKVKMTKKGTCSITVTVVTGSKKVKKTAKFTSS